MHVKLTLTAEPAELEALNKAITHAMIIEIQPKVSDQPDGGRVAVLEFEADADSVSDVLMRLNQNP